tara:strand:+ start:568 stop:813 length:246 start_codon:yes stop_codon:yes gene_type:complete
MTKMQQAWKILSSSADREEHDCVLCGIKFRGYGHNPEPLAEKGRCCDSCNDDVVAQRLRDAIAYDKEFEVIRKQREARGEN